jgi:phage FluMu gp28-like protein
MKKIDYSKFGFLPYQCKWLEDRSQIKLLVKSRRTGGTRTQAFEDVEDAGVNGLFDVWFSSNNDLNAQEYIGYCQQFARALNAVCEAYDETVIIEEKKILTHCVKFSNGKKITGLSSSPEMIHGKGGKIVLDEFARRKDEAEIWEAGSPAALIWKYPMRIISTQKGKTSLFYSFIKRIEKGKLNWSLHKIGFTEAVRQGLADKVFKRKLSIEEQDAYIKDVHDSVGDETIWLQQFECEPQDGDETLIKRPVLEMAAKAELYPKERLHECKELYAGLDVARKTNFSLLWLSEKVTPSLFVARYILAIQGVEFPKQDKIIGAILKEFPNIRRLSIDQTGMGIGLTEYLQEQFGKTRIEGVTFTMANKEAMGFRMSKMLEDLSFLIPEDEKLYDDFQLVKKVITSGGNIRLVAGTKDDSHADYFWGAALSLEAGSTEAYIPPAVHVANMTNQRTNRVDKMLQGFSRE